MWKASKPWSAASVPLWSGLVSPLLESRCQALQEQRTSSRLMCAQRMQVGMSGPKVRWSGYAAECRQIFQSEFESALKAISKNDPLTQNHSLVREMILQKTFQLKWWISRAIPWKALQNHEKSVIISCQRVLRSHSPNWCLKTCCVMLA